MKKVLIMTAMVLAIASMAIAQDATVEKKWNVYVGPSLSLPMSDFGDAYKMGFGAFGAFGYTVYPGLQVLPKVEFNVFSIDDQGVANVSGGSLKALMFGADLRYAFPMENSSISPFILGGGGFANLSISDLTIGDSTFTFDSETKAYFEIGAGAEFKATPTLSIFVQGRYASIQTEGSSSSFIPITVGVKF